MLQGDVTDGRDAEEAGEQVGQLGGEDAEQRQAAVQPGQCGFTAQQLSVRDEVGRPLSICAPAPSLDRLQVPKGHGRASGFSSGPMLCISSESLVFQAKSHV